MTRTLLLIVLALSVVANAVVSTIGDGLTWNIVFGSVTLLSLIGLVLTRGSRSAG